jgi:hypothetical protein
MRFRLNKTDIHEVEEIQLKTSQGIAFSSILGFCHVLGSLYEAVKDTHSIKLRNKVLKEYSCALLARNMVWEDLLEDDPRSLSVSLENNHWFKFADRQEWFPFNEPMMYPFNIRTELQQWVNDVSDVELVSKF